MEDRRFWQGLAGLLEGGDHTYMTCFLAPERCGAPGADDSPLKALESKYPIPPTEYINRSMINLIEYHCKISEKGVE